MWRDRTNLYISYRQSFAHHPTKKPRYFGPSQGFNDSHSLSEERRGLIAGADGLDDDGDAVIEMDLLPPRWVDVQEEVSETLAEIAQKAARLDKLHQKHILPSFGDETARKEDEALIEQYTQEVTRGFHNCQTAIKRIESMVREQKQLGGVAKGDEAMARNIQISLASRVQEASARFRKKQSTYLRKLRELEGMALPFERAATPIQTPFSDPSLMESDADRSFSQTTIQQTLQKQQQQVVGGANDAVIAQREREINDIAQGIIELSDIFRELQTMIIDQGTMLDRIDYNVERMATDVKEANTELKVANTYQRKTTKRKIILLLILLMIGMIVLLVLKPKNSHHSSPQNNEANDIIDTNNPASSEEDQQRSPAIHRKSHRSVTTTHAKTKEIDNNDDDRIIMESEDIRRNLHHYHHVWRRNNDDYYNDYGRSLVWSGLF